LKTTTLAHFYNSVTSFYSNLHAAYAPPDTFVVSFKINQGVQYRRPYIQNLTEMYQKFTSLLSIGFVLLLQTTQAQEPFNNCAAAFLNDKLVVDNYSPDGQCRLAQNATGTLTVCTADLSPERSVPVAKIKFMVAIRDKNTKTMVMYSKDVLQSVDVAKILSKCKAGDSIVLLTLADQYALPHNEILVTDPKL
jgi:hypothetical protein